MAKRTERAHVKYTAAQVFDLVADIERYPDFLPWVIAAGIRRRQGLVLWVDMTMGMGFLRKTFSTIAELDRPHRIDISSHDPLFERFEQKWRFQPAADGGTNVEYEVDFRFRSGLLQRLIGSSFADRAGAMIDAFRHRARRLYGVR
jgi:coenzyme Q-binding protein COQ10